MSVAPFEFVPLKLIVEPDVTVDPKCQDQIPGRLLYGRWSLRNVSCYGKSSIKSPEGLFIARTFEREEGLIKLSEDCGFISP